MAVTSTGLVKEWMSRNQSLEKAEDTDPDLESSAGEGKRE
jgi:hypothetical protein